MSAIQEIFKANAREKPNKTLGDYAFLALKTVLFPITILCYLVSRACSSTAYYFGVGSTKERREIDGTKHQELLALGGDPILFITEDDKTLEEMYFNNPNPAKSAKTILICSGSHSSHQTYTAPMVDALLKMGHHVMVFNYRGFGHSSGDVSEEGFYLDAEAAYQYLRETKEKSDNEIIAFGYSMGSAPATDLAAHHKIDLVLDRYFSSMEEVAKDEGGSVGFITKCIFHIGDCFPSSL